MNKKRKYKEYGPRNRTKFRYAKYPPKNIREWLAMHGGRLVSDLHSDEHGIHILLGSGYGDYKKKYVPKELQ